MYTIYNMTLISTDCPKQMTEKDCPLRKYLNSSESMFHISINETLLIPKTQNEVELGHAIKDVYQKCHECHKQNAKQR